MIFERHWDPCILHRGSEVEKFVKEYFTLECRKLLLVAGAGFDPRSTAVASLLGKSNVCLRALFIREDRLDSPDSADILRHRAEKNIKELSRVATLHEIVSVDIFGEDGAVTGGRNAITKLNNQTFDGITDVVIDISALSVGTSFPIIRYFIERVEQGLDPQNIHVLVAHAPQLDANIRSTSSGAPGYVHGFKGGLTLDHATTSAKLWLPQLATGCRSVFERLFNFIVPHDTCPILPFPAAAPRRGDKLAEEYRVEFESTWSVDSRNIVYADEGDPLDLYRTILRLDDLRKPVFTEFGGSLLVVSPAGSKVMALGALMAALERDLAVAHIESISYDLDTAVPDHVTDPDSFIHIWLEGEVYPDPRPRLKITGMARQ